MKKGIQSLLEHISSYGCYFLCLLEKAGYSHQDIIDMYITCLEKGFIDKDCTVLDGSKLATFLFKTPLTCTIENDKPNNAVFYIECWYNKRTGYKHFKLPEWDSLENSVTVKEGSIISYRVFRA